MSSRGIQDLRDARRNNPNMFRIIVKKMKSVVFHWSSCTCQILITFVENFPTATSQMTTRRG
jgi:hypothetical protein